jgi:hypothetical protein
MTKSGENDLIRISIFFDGQLNTKDMEAEFSGLSKHQRVVLLKKKLIKLSQNNFERVRALDLPRMIVPLLTS